MPPDLKEILTREDVELILELEFQYQQLIGLVTEDSGSGEEGPVIVMGEVVGFIREGARREGRSYKIEQIESVLEAEEVYLEKIGVIE